MWVTALDDVHKLVQFSQRRRPAHVEGLTKIPVVQEGVAFFMSTNGVGFSTHVED